MTDFASAYHYSKDLLIEQLENNKRKEDNTMNKNWLVSHVSKEELVEAYRVQSGTNPVEINGYPTFNTCDHHLVDMSHLQAGGDEWMNTISVRLKNGKYVTLCVMDLNDSIDVDVQFHNFGESKALGFKDGKSDILEDFNLYAVVAKKEKTL